MKKRNRLFWAGILSLIYLAALAYFARFRGLDPDEGFYPLAAKLVWEGRIPYHDFLFSQGVVIPYVYSWVLSIFPRSLIAMRLLSVLFGSLAVFLLGLFLFSI